MISAWAVTAVQKKLHVGRKQRTLNGAALLPVPLHVPERRILSPDLSDYFFLNGLLSGLLSDFLVMVTGGRSVAGRALSLGK